MIIFFFFFTVQLSSHFVRLHFKKRFTQLAIQFYHKTVLEMNRQSLQQFKLAPVKAYLHNTNLRDKYQLHTGHSSAEQKTLVSGHSMNVRENDIYTENTYTS